MKTFKVLILTPDSPAIIIDNAVSAVVPSAPGSFGVLAGHAAMVAPVGAGILRCSDESGVWRFFVVGDGTADVSPADGMVLMVGSAKPAADEMQAEELLDRLVQAV